MDTLLARLIDYEATDGSGDPGGLAAAPAVEAGADPAPPAEPAAAPEGGAPSSGEPEAPAWAGVTADDWQAYQDRQAQLEAQQAELTQYLLARDQDTGQPDVAAEKANLYGLYEQALLEQDAQTAFQVMERLNEINFEERMSSVRPAIQAAEEQRAEQLARGWLTELKVPEADWEDVALLGNGFRANVPNIDGRQAAQVAYQRLQERDQRVRADERAKIEQEQQAQQETLRNRVNAPSTPTGPGGVETPFAEGEDEIAGWRRWRAQQAAANGQ